VNELSDQARGVIFVVIALAVLFIWSHYFSPAPPAQKNTPGNAVGGQQVPQPQKPAPAAPLTPTVPPAPVRNVAVARATAEKLLEVDSPLYRVEISNRGGVVRSWRLKQYLNDEKPPRPLDLVNSQSSQELGWPFSLMLENTQLENEANNDLYQLTTEPEPAGGAADQTAFEAPVAIHLHFSDGHLDVTKKLNFDRTYQLRAEISVSLDGKPLPVGLAWRGGFGDKEVYRAAQLVNVFYQQGDKLNLLPYKKLGVSGNQSQPALEAGPLEFNGIEDQFFTAAFIPDGTPDFSLWNWTQNRNVTTDGKQESEPVAEMAAAGAQPTTLRMQVYVGPKDLDLLGKLRPSLEGLVNFGWTTVIAKPLLMFLQWLYHYIPNYGWAIVVLTLIINFALFPLKMKSWRSMQKMQKVAPEIRSIQDRYKKYSMTDPRKRKMNEEVMAVYQREGINPMGSCLPMVLQMPIWWALWRALTGAIELRHAPWILWIHDLSAKDPYYILPIAMAITMYLMTKMTPQTITDPAQQKMTTLMPLMFAAFFFTLSSGLNLYMFTSNLVGVGQQYYLNRTQPLPSRSKFKKKQKPATA
jgi:YidC/Oxa1 family membrane protein insertase